MKTILKMLQEVKELPDLVYCEFLKLKRKKFIILTVFAAALFPIPMTVFAATGNVRQGWLYSTIFEFGYFLILAVVLGILGAVLFFSERSNETWKNLGVIPVSAASLIVAKIVTLLLFSVIYSFVINGVALIGSVIIGSSDHIPDRFLFGLLVGIMVAVSVLPVLTVECLSTKGYVFSIIISLVYTVVSFISVLSISNLILPLSAVFRWALPYMATGTVEGFENWFFSFPACIGILTLTAVASVSLAVIFKSRQEG